MGGLGRSLKIMKNIIQDNLRYMLSLGILIASLSMPVVSAEWEKVESQGVTYTTTNSLNKFYKFKSQEEQEGYLVFSNKRVNMKLPLDGKVAYFNGVKVFLDRSLLLADNKHLVSTSTVSRVIDPLLRPERIKGLPKGGILKHVMLKVDDDTSLSVAKQVQKMLASRAKVVVVNQGEDKNLKESNKASGYSCVIELACSKKEKEQSSVLTSYYNRNVGGEECGLLDLALAVSLHGNVYREAKVDRGVRAGNKALIIDGGLIPTVKLDIGLDAMNLERSSASVAKRIVKGLLKGDATLRKL